MDTGILYGIQDYLAHPFLDAVMPSFTLLGEAGAIWVVIGIALLFSRKWRFWGICVLVALTCVLLFNELGIKYLVGRVRPYLAEGYQTLLLAPPTSYSFPSGHAGCAFAAATVIARSPAHRGLKAFVWIFACAIAFSRLYLFVHYPSDVLVGALLGALYGWIVVSIAKKLQLRHEQNAAKPL